MNIAFRIKGDGVDYTVSISSTDPRDIATQEDYDYMAALALLMKGAVDAGLRRNPDKD